ncbi:MAG: hypothetical protein NPIRA01_08640 [Nitrospirales bacterium]|nr:MAG: hypothetical protein NPIRA01_08640 [Nitrospirales bacterium]
MVIRVINEAPAGNDSNYNTIEPAKYPWTGTVFLNEKIVESEVVSQRCTLIGWTELRSRIHPEFVRLDLNENLSLGAMSKRKR